MKLRFRCFGILCLVYTSGCALRQAPAQPHVLFAKDNEVKEADEAVRFAVIGNSRRPIRWKDSGSNWAIRPGTGALVAADLSGQVLAGGLDFAVFVGDEVRWGVDSEWGRFTELFNESLLSESMAQGEQERIPALFVAGERSFVFDDKLALVEKTFPGTGAPIGFKRVASWYAFDLKVGGETWRMMTLDSNLKAMGSRAREQAAWIPKAAKGDYEHLLIFMHNSRVTLGKDTEMNAGSIPSDLIDLVEEHTGILKLRTVFSADSHTSEAFLPEGPIGTAYLVSGSGGDVSQDLERWGSGEAAGYEDLALEPLFDLSLQTTFNALAERVEIGEGVFDKARAEGDWEGFVGTYDAKSLPLTGYWVVELQSGSISMVYRHLDEAGEGRDIYRLEYVAGRGWAGSQLP